jgi:PAS domain S-box-containing protein
VWFQEITEHKRAALALAVSEQRAHLAMELARAGTWEWDLTSGRNHWSEELWTLYGLEPGVREPSFELWRESVHPEDVGEVMASLEASVKRGEELNLEWRVGAGGVERWLMSRGRPLRDGSGRVVRYLGIVIDISERRRLEEEARRWLTVFHSAQFGLAYASVTDNSFLGMNDAFARERGYTPGELVGRSFMEIYPPEERLAQKERVRLIDAQGHLVFDSVHQRKDGTRFPVLMEVTVIKDASGRPQSRVAYALDITERKRAEAALQERNEELVRFIYTVSHDLKSPLVTIRTFLGYLEQDLRTGDAERVEKDMGYMRRAAEKMVNLLEDLLDLSRVGRKTNPMEDVTLQALVRDALDLVAGAIAERGVRVEVTEAPVLLTGDRGRLLEVFQNLIDNAVKFMGEQASPRVDIGVEDGADGLVLFVRDNGIGIDPRHHGKLFGLFEKLHPGTPGTGIGLALVKRIVEVHGGRIWAESGGAGQGTVFRFTLARLRRATPTPPTQG